MNKQSTNDIRKFFSGEAVYGDDFSIQEIEKWYKEEEEAYAEMYGEDILNTNDYEFHSLNKFYGFRHLPQEKGVFKNALGFGSSWGYEFMPIIERIRNLTILEPSLQTRSTQLENVFPQYYQPNISGAIDFPDNSFDLVVCLSAMHHVPNSSFVINELFRVLAPGGYMLFREPIHTLGDWRQKRRGLTKNERGFPAAYLDKIIAENGLEVIHKSYYYSMHSFMRRFIHSNRFFESSFYLNLDKLLSKILTFNIHYHPKNAWEKVSPSAVFYVLRKN